MNRKEAIQNIIDNRKIEHLVHFTPIENVNLILEKGIYSRKFIFENLKNNFEGACYTDHLRLDGMTDGTCLSITFPNEIMFGMKRRENKGKWAVIMLDANIMTDLDCMFFPTNAAQKVFRSYNEKYLKSAAALEAMFHDRVETPKRTTLRESYLLDKDTTCIQAEVMVFEHISTKYIKGCIFNSNSLKENYSSLHKNYDFFSCENYYGVFDNRSIARYKNFQGC